MIAEEGTYPAGCEVLLLEDDPPLRRRLAAHLRTLKAEVTEASTIEEARRILRDLRFDFALVDLHLPDGEALELLRDGAFSENTGVVVMTGFGGVKKAVEAMRLGAGVWAERVASDLASYGFTVEAGARYRFVSLGLELHGDPPFDAALKGAFLVALTGYALPEDLERARAAGFARHLAKPPSLEKLGEILAVAP